jgi:subtilisin
MPDFDFSEHKTGNLLVAVRLPLAAVTRELLRTLLPDSIPIPLVLEKTGFNFPSGPTIVQLPTLFPLLEFETELVIVEPEYFVYLPAQRNTPALPAVAPAWGVVETGVRDSPCFGEGIKLAVLDSGLDFGHPDFLGRVAPGDWRDFTGTGIDDQKGHGTYCAGIAAGPANPKLTGRYGVASDATLLIGKIFDLEQTRCPDFRVLRAIIWAALKDADVISLSWGLPISPGKRLSKIYELVAAVLLHQTDTIIVASTGNGSERPLYPRPIYHPADCPTIIAVAGLTSKLTVADFSSGAIGAQRDPSLSGPGVNVISSAPRRSQPAFPYSEEDGTSASAAFVAGIAALWAEQSGDRGSALRNLVVSKFRTLAGEKVEDVGAGLAIAP